MAIPFARQWEPKRRGRTTPPETPDYYGLPAIHKPHWRWEIVLYFFLGGIAGASYAIASIAGWVADAEDQDITRVGRYLALAALVPCPILLILDLGRPERFHHMLRSLKLRSPMSLGVWDLLLFSGFCGLSALSQAARDGLFGRGTGMPRLLRAVPPRAVGLLGLAPALFLSGYTGVLLAATAVPLWTRNYLLLGPLFLTSAMSNATAAIALTLALRRGTRPATLARLERLDSIALLAELGLLLATRANLGPTVGGPLREGRLGGLHRFGVLGLGVAAPLALQVGGRLRGRHPSRARAILTSALVLGGGLALRYVMMMGGRASADDPHATFALDQPGDR